VGDHEGDGHREIAAGYVMRQFRPELTLDFANQNVWQKIDGMFC